MHWVNDRTMKRLIDEALAEAKTIFVGQYVEIGMKSVTTKYPDSIPHHEDWRRVFRKEAGEVFDLEIKEPITQPIDDCPDWLAD